MTLTPEAHREVYDSLHRTNIPLPNCQLDIQLEHQEKEKSRLIVHWLSAIIGAKGAKQFVSSITGDPEHRSVPSQKRQWQLEGSGMSSNHTDTTLCPVKGG